ncbi:LuxR C-terminal-related transcriptional regulator [Actinokineospora sp. PR83]|uniref:helix-turn-helix transcriptional regulator n=1 Tax=Actinokineospora sp. PR83 TaxID=2884908 RepID=UPI0027E13C82|nr:LuxR C-terminal-related transcriptional regulator [Actinokineospora sp. PR83]MCG8914784.1 LuxR C-terminal-related transcriptional regulator [Actinokineospora sp. PR83]
MRERFPAPGLGALTQRVLVGVSREITVLATTYRPGAPEFSREVAETILRRGGTVRVVLATDLLAVDAVSDHAGWLAARGAPPRTADRVPLHTLLIDDDLAVVTDPTGERFVREPARLDALHATAERLWARGVPLAHLPRSRPRTEQVLRLLAEGLTDEAVARRIGVSVRTVRNDIATTMTGMDAHSRFQAGVRAAQLGLI